MDMKIALFFWKKIKTSQNVCTVFGKYILYDEIPTVIILFFLWDSLYILHEKRVKPIKNSALIYVVAGSREQTQE